MKVSLYFLGLVVLLGCPLKTQGQAEGVKRIVLTPSSTVSAAAIADGIEKNCTGLTVTLDAAKADYKLEAVETEKIITDSDHRTKSISHIELTLFSADGDILAHAREHHADSAMKNICKAMGHETPKHKK
jgi:hypothetical protein